MATRSEAPVLVSPEEYLAREREAEERSEYWEGEIFTMSGASPRHGAIVVNLAVSLHGQLRGSPCSVLVTNMRVKAARTSAYFYPDVVVTCGGSQLEDQHQDTLLNPTLIIEVLSPSTADYDHGRKWEHYRRIASLQDYLLIAQDQPRVERYTRQGDLAWLFSETVELEDVIHLDSIGCTLALRDIYENVLPSEAGEGASTKSDHG